MPRTLIVGKFQARGWVRDGQRGTGQVVGVKTRIERRGCSIFKLKAAIGGQVAVKGRSRARQHSKFGGHEGLFALVCRKNGRGAGVRDARSSLVHGEVQGAAFLSLSPRLRDFSVPWDTRIDTIYRTLLSIAFSTSSTLFLPPLMLSKTYWSLPYKVSARPRSTLLRRINEI